LLIKINDYSSKASIVFSLTHRIELSFLLVFLYYVTTYFFSMDSIILKQFIVIEAYFGDKHTNWLRLNNEGRYQCMIDFFLCGLKACGLVNKYASFRLICCHKFLKFPPNCWRHLFTTLHGLLSQQIVMLMFTSVIIQKYHNINQI
jgi:hypothetical protein